MANLRVQRRDHTEQALAAQARHPLITKNNVVILIFDLFEGLGAGIRHIDSRALASQYVEYQLGDMNLIVDDEDLLPAQEFPLQCTSGWNCLRPDRGAEWQL